MECNVVKDLIPLYIDNCCSGESAAIVKEHLAVCSQCKELYESMKAPSEIAPAVSAPVRLSRVNDWRASILQSIMLVVSFAIITIGVALEAATPSGGINGCWAVALIIPATGLLLSLVNWYFVRIYKSRKVFSCSSLMVTFGITVCAYIWAWVHYGFRGLERPFLTFLGIGILLTTVCSTLSIILSNQYARMLGKE